MSAFDGPVGITLLIDVSAETLLTHVKWPRTIVFTQHHLYITSTDLSSPSSLIQPMVSEKENTKS